MRKLVFTSFWLTAAFTAVILIMFSPRSWYCSVKNYVDSLSTARDGSVLVAQSNGRIDLWKTDAAQPEWTRWIGAYIRDGVSYSRDGSRVLSISNDGTARLWDPQTGALLLTLERNSVFSSAAFSPDGTRIVTVSNDDKLYLWDTTTGKLLSIWMMHGIHGASYSPDGERILTVHTQDIAHVLDAHTGMSILTLHTHHAVLLSAVYSPDGSHIVTCGMDGTAQTWDARTGKALQTLYGHTSGVTNAMYSPDGQRIVTTSNDFTAREWDATTGVSLLTLTVHSPNYVNNAAFSPDGTQIVTSSEDGTARVWNAHSGDQLLEVQLQQEEGVNEAWFSPDGTRLLIVNGIGQAHVYDAHNGKRLLTMPAEIHHDILRGVHLSADAQYIASDSKDHTIRLWDTPRGKPLHTIDGNMMLIGFTPDSEQIASSSIVDLQFTDVRSGEKRFVLGSDKPDADMQFYSVAFSPDGQHLVTASGDSLLSIWDTHTRTRLMQIEGPRSFYRVQYTPDGTRLVTNDLDGMVRVWDAHTGALLISVQEQRYAPFTVALSPDSKRFAVTSHDATVHTLRVWDINTGMQAFEMRFSPGNGLRSPTFSADGRYIYVLVNQTVDIREKIDSTDTIVNVYDAQNGAFIRPLCPVLLGSAWSAVGVGLAALCVVVLLRWGRAPHSAGFSRHSKRSGEKG